MILDLEHGLVIVDKGEDHVTLIVLAALLVDGEVELRLEGGDLLEVVLQTDGEGAGSRLAS